MCIKKIKDEQASTMNLGIKIHIIQHAISFLRCWGCSAALYDEQSLESFHQICIKYLKLYTPLKGDHRLFTVVRRINVETCSQFQ